MTMKILIVSKMILRSNLIISCLDSVMFLFLLKYIYLRTVVIRFSAVSYGTYNIEAFVNLTFYDVKQLEVMASSLHYLFQLLAFAF